jgi:hypothetical protein
VHQVLQEGSLIQAQDVKRPLAFAGLLLAGACTVTRPLPVALDAAPLSAFLAEHPQADLRVVEHSGKRYWIHRAAVKGDSLVGRKGYDVPVQPLSVPLESVAELGASHFSLGRTSAAVGGVLLATGLALVILLEGAEGEPVD